MNITSEKAAEMLGIKEATLRKWRGNGVGPAYIKKGKKGRFSHYEEEKVLDWIKKNNYENKEGKSPKIYAITKDGKLKKLLTDTLKLLG